MSASDHMIRAMTHPQGDWYMVTIARDHKNGDRWFIDRVVLWALRSGDKVVDHVSAVGCTGLPDDDDAFADRFYVCGVDVCPDGRTWNDIYRGVHPSHVMVREITEEGRKWADADQAKR